MTYEEVRILFSKYPVASTWNSANPRALHFDTGPRQAITTLGTCMPRTEASAT